MSLRLQCSSLAGVLAPVNLLRRGCRSTGGCWPAISPHLPLFITLSRYLPSSPAIAHSLPYSPVLAGTSPQSSAIFRNLPQAPYRSSLSPTIALSSRLTAWCLKPLRLSTSFYKLKNFKHKMLDSFT